MKDQRLNWIRWAAVLPVTLLATVIVRTGAETVFRYALFASLEFQSWMPWIAKALASILMGIVFVLVARAIAPSSKHLVAVLAVVAIAFQAFVMLLTAGGAANPGWTLIIGLFAIAGAVLAFFLSRRRIGRIAR